MGKMIMHTALPNNEYEEEYDYIFERDGHMKV